MLLTYSLNDFEIVPVAPVITGIIFVFTFHMRCISIVIRIFSASFLIKLIIIIIIIIIIISISISIDRIGIRSVCWAAGVVVWGRVGFLHRRILKWVYKAENVVNWHD